MTKMIGKIVVNVLLKIILRLIVVVVIIIMGRRTVLWVMLVISLKY